MNRELEPENLSLNGKKTLGNYGFSRFALYLLAIIVISILLHFLPGRTQIAPWIQSDNNYIYLSADRMYTGLGPTAIPPQAPFQPWEWYADWDYLTKWPLGYASLLCAVKYVFGVTTVKAGQSIAVVSVAIALVAWFAWARRTLKPGVAGILLAVVTAGAAVSTDALVNPATDTILVALLPVMLLLFPKPREEVTAEVAGQRGGSRFFWLRLITTGFLAGSLCWIRFAAIFVPVGIGITLLLLWVVFRKFKFGHVATYAVGSITPIAVLFVVQKYLASASGLQESFNLGRGMSFAIEPYVFKTIWLGFTKLPFYDYLEYSHFVYAVVIPLLVLTGVLFWPALRKNVRIWAGRQEYLLGVVIVLTMFTVLAATSILFRVKHTYVDIPRYYIPVKPFYFLILIGPLLCIPRKSLRALACLPLLMCVSWYIQQEWPRPYRRWLAKDFKFTDYGRRSVYFEPNANDVYRWLKEVNSKKLVVFSNFHDEIALETWIPACPIPDNRETLNRWLDKIAASRNERGLRVLFVLDPSNHTREYFLPEPSDVVSTFDLITDETAPDTVQPYTFVYEQADYASLRVAGQH